MSNKAHAADPDAGISDDLNEFYGPVLEDPMGSVTGFGTFLADVAEGATSLGKYILDSAGVKSMTGTLATAFNFSSGAVVVGAGLYAAYKVTDVIFGAKPAPAAT